MSNNRDQSKTAGSGAGAALHAFIAGRRAEDERLYAVVDAARDRELAFVARDKFHQPIRSLFGTGTVREMDAVAPYLVSLAIGANYPYEGSGYLDLWAAKLGSSGGILLLASTSEQDMWSHLRKVFHVTDEEKHRYYFRFYDPRVLRTFLPACTADDASEFFGPARMIVLEAESPGRLLAFRPGHRGVVKSEHELSGPSRVTSERADT